MVAAITVTALALAVIAPPTAAAAPADEAAADHETAGPITDVPQVVAESVPVDDPESVVEYWTEERMQSARPLELELPLDEVAMRGLGVATAEDELVHDTRRLTVEEVDRHPHASIGKVFFVLHGFNFFCSAAAVTSAGRWGEGSGQLVLTAGHCLNDGDGTFATEFVFVPGYHYDEAWGEDYDDEDVAPSGRWVAQRLFTTSEWSSQLGLGYARDVGFALVTGTEAYAGERLHDIVEPLDIAFTQPYPEDGLHLGVVPSIGMEYAIFGYGVANWGGEQQVRTLSAIDRSDPSFLPSPFGAPSTHTGGASGGPWLFNYAEDQDSPHQNVITGLNGYVYNGIDRLYSPQLDDRIHGLWMYVNRVDTTTTVDAAPSPSVFGQPVTVTATVESDDGMPTGSVTFTETTTDTVLGMGPLDDGGAAELSIDPLPAGTHTIQATYSGDDNFNPSTGTAIHTTEGASTTTTVTTSPNPSVAGRSVTVTATVESTDGVPTGSVTFTDNATDTTLGTGTLDDDGAVELTIDSLPAGTHTIEATYSGDDNFTPSTGTAIHTVRRAPTTTPVVTPFSTTTTVTSSPNPSVLGQEVTVRATVESDDGVPTGSVTFTDTTTDTTLGTGTLDEDGATELTIDPLPVGTHTIQGAYEGTDDFTASSDTVTQTVEPVPPVEPAPRSITIVEPGTGPDPVGQAIAWSRHAIPTSDISGFAQVGARTVLLGRADEFADSLTSGGAQGRLDAPLLLTDRDKLDWRVTEELQRLRADTVILLGGTAALSAGVAADLHALGYAVRRLAGSTRIETAVEVAQTIAPTTSTAIVARAFPAPDGEPTQGFADALAAGALAAHLGVPLLLTETDRLSAATASYLRQAMVTNTIVIGGTAAVGDEVLDELTALGITPTRSGGATRFATATAIAAARGAATAADADGTILVDGSAADAWADAFPAALFASRTLRSGCLDDGAPVWVGPQDRRVVEGVAVEDEEVGDRADHRRDRGRRGR
jgi:putative cell wall-binding protein